MDFKLASLTYECLNKFHRDCMGSVDNRFCNFLLIRGETPESVEKRRRLTVDSTILLPDLVKVSD